MVKTTPSRGKNATLTEESFDTTPQQTLLLLVMAELDLSKEDFAKRMGCSIKTLEKWLRPEVEGALNFRRINGTIRNHLREIIEHERLKKTQSQTR